MQRGYVKLWRKTLDSGLLQNGPAWQLFGYLLLRATHKPRRIIVGGVVCELVPGEIVFGRSKAAADLGLSEQQIRTALNLLKKMEIATSRSTNKFTVVLLVNWHNYQDEQTVANQQTNQPATSTQPAVNHIQELENIYISSSLRSEEIVGATAPTSDQQAEGLEQVEDHQPAQKPTAPPCPHQQILDLYHELLPELPCMKVWNGTRQQHLAARWRERWKSKSYSTQAEGLAYFRRLFEYIGRECDWLMGRVQGREGKPFLATLAWIVSPGNFAKIIEGNYARREVV